MASKKRLDDILGKINSGDLHVKSDVNQTRGDRNHTPRGVTSTRTSLQPDAQGTNTDLTKPAKITADVSGEAWTRATPSQTKIKTKSLDTSVGGLLYDKEPSDKNSLAHKAWENQQKYAQLTKETPTTDPVERAQQQKKERVNSLINKYDEKAYQDTFTGQTKANYGLGRLTQDQSKAWNDYLDNPTAENRKKAEALDNVIRNFQINNQSALDDEGAVLPWISKSAANYVPQLIDQTKAEIGGGAVGALAG